MIRLLRVPVVAWGLAALTVLGAVYGLGRVHGAGAEADRYRAKAEQLQARLDLYADRVAADAERLRRLEAEAGRLGQELEDAAHADDDAGRRALGADSVRRIFSR